MNRTLYCLTLSLFPLLSVQAQSSDSAVKVMADQFGLRRLPPAELAGLPKGATYWEFEAENPFPLPLLNGDFPVWKIQDNVYLVDASGHDANLSAQAIVRQAINVSNLVMQVRSRAASSGVSRHGLTALEAGGPLPGGTNTDNGTGGYTNLYELTPLNTNELYLTISQVIDGLAYLNLGRATDSVYGVYQSSDLVTPLTNWLPVAELWPTNETTNLLSFAIPVSSTSHQFYAAMDWGNAAAGYYTVNGLPAWWTFYWFGTLSNLYDATLDRSGNTLLSDYESGREPNLIAFTVRLGNQHFNTANVTGSYQVTGGIPYYEATLVNDTNLDDAVWTYYDGLVHLNLGPTNGAYAVSIGLKGCAPDATPTWLGTTVYLETDAPAIVITNPTVNVVAQPYLQLQGYANKDLQGITYDLSNAVSVLTNQDGSITSRYLDTNGMDFTTNWFQCYDLLLNEGTNQITLHATDLAGNVTTTNLAVVLDYSSATNPIIKLAWPHNGDQICQSNFTLRGWTEDAGATVSAQITDTNGDTNVVSGMVERTGNLWVENLPLNAGTNEITLWVTNSAGLSSETNISVVKNDMVLTLTNIDGDLWLPAVKVSGLISDPDAPVWVNGVPGTNNGDGTWSAANVPVSAGGVAAFDMAADDDGQTTSANTNADKPTGIYLASVSWKDKQEIIAPSNGDQGMIVNYVASDWNYTYGKGGEYHQTEGTIAAQGGGAEWEQAFIQADGSITNVHYMDTDGGDDYEAYEGELMWLGNFPQDIGSLTAQISTATYTRRETTSGKASWVYHLGGQGETGGQSLLELTGGATEQVGGAVIGNGAGYVLNGAGLAGPEITVADKQLDENYLAYKIAPAGSSVSLPVQADVPLAKTRPGATKYTLTHICVADTPTNKDRLTIGVCEEVDLGGMPGNTVWSTSAGSLSTTNGAGVHFMAPDIQGTATITATVKDTSLALSFNVIKPSGALLENKTNTLTTSTNPLGLGYQAYWYIPPDSVSFYNIKIAEGVTNSIATGYYYPSENNEPHIPGTPLQGGVVVSGKGTLCSGYDNISGGSHGPPPYTNGTFTWHIPWSYITPRGTTNYFTTVNHIKTLTGTSSNVTLSITKKGSSGSVTFP